MVDTFDLDQDPRHHHDRASKLRQWAAETIDYRLQSELRVLADEYDKLASDLEQRRMTPIQAQVINAVGQRLDSQ